MWSSYNESFKVTCEMFIVVAIPQVSQKVKSEENYI